MFHQIRLFEEFFFFFLTLLLPRSRSMFHQIRLFEEFFFFFFFLRLVFVVVFFLKLLFKFKVCRASKNKKNKKKLVLLSDMPTDILNCIQERLPLADYLRFPAVCTSFRSAANQISRIPFSDTHSPWLLDFSSLYSKKLTATAAPLSPSPPRRKYYSIPFPPLFKDYDILSSNRHCLFIEDQCFLRPPSQGIYIVNPFDSWTLLGRLPPSPSSSRLGSISNLAVNNTNTVALGICGRLHLVYTRTTTTTTSSSLEDIDDQRRWIPLNDKLPPPTDTNRFQDVVAYKDDLFYVVRMNATNILALDFSSSPTATSVRVTDMTLNLQLCREIPGWSCFQAARLIASPSGLFLVRWRCLLKEEEKRRREIDVYRLMDDLYAPNKWVQINSLDNFSFFFAMHSSISFSPVDIPGLRSNCIYLPHDAAWNIRHDYTDFYEGDIDNLDVTRHLIYDLADGNWEQLYAECSLGLLVTPRLRADNLLG